MNDDDIDAIYTPLLDRVAARREEMERMLDKVALTEDQLKRLLKMAWDESVDLDQLNGPVATNHRDTCRSWLPTVGQCACHWPLPTEEDWDE